MHTRLHSLVRILVATLAYSWVSAGTAWACDICAVYASTEAHRHHSGFRLGVAEQFTHFSTLRRDGHDVANPNSERMSSSITQILGAWRFDERWSAQVSLPLIARSFRRVKEGQPTPGDENGIGDVVVTGSWTPWLYADLSKIAAFTINAGVKVPTGSSDLLREEAEQAESEPDPFEAGWRPSTPSRQAGSGGHADHQGEEGGLHSHDIALGTGSTDIVLGSQGFASWDRFYLSGMVQYVIRTRGSFDYEYANDLMWNIGPGVFLLVRHDLSLGIGTSISGETKGTDDIDGRRLGDTGATSLYAGPTLRWTWTDHLAGDLAADLPTIQNTSSLQLVPDYRVRGGMIWRF